MAKPPEEKDPRITDLARYRKAREAEKRRKPPNPKAQMRETLLGTHPRAGLILAALVVVALLLSVGPMLLRLLR